MKKIIDEIRKLEAIQCEHSRFGACDTEPDGVWQRAVADYIDHGECIVPRTISDWQIFGAEIHGPEYVGAGKVARALTKQLRAVLKAIDKASYREVQAIRNGGLLWRC